MNLKKWLKNNLKCLIIIIIMFLATYIELPYYIETSGGILNLNERIEMETKKEITGSLNMTYVSEMKVNVFTYIFSFLNKNYDLIKKSEIINSNETEEMSLFRSKMMLKEANNNALINAYKAANKEITIKDRKLYVTYIDKLSNSDLKIGDEIIKINDIEVSTKTDIKNIIDKQEVGNKIEIEVINNNEVYTRYAYVILYEENKMIGVMLTEDMTLETNPTVTFKFKKSESGSSGGLMTSLAIYNNLVDIDITNGLKISGTGTIDSEGNVGEISGIKYKLRGAVKEKSDLFIVPNGNLDEALKEKELNNYEIDIIGVDTFNEVLDYLIK